MWARFRSVRSKGAVGFLSKGDTAEFKENGCNPNCRGKLLGAIAVAIIVGAGFVMDDDVDGEMTDLEESTTRSFLAG